MRNELQKYLDRLYPGSQIGVPHSIFGAVHVRFELGGDETFKIIREGVEIEWWNDRRRMTKVDKLNEEKHIQNRVAQATSRATTIFYETFQNSETEIWVLIHEYPGDIFNKPTDYLFKQFPSAVVASFYDNKELIELESFETAKNGLEPIETMELRIILGKVRVKDIQVEKILNGIANKEMGLPPAIDQDVYFLDPISNIGFKMYDDRGCFVWSDQADKIKYLYTKRNDWIVDYHRPEIDEYFKGK